MGVWIVDTLRSVTAALQSPAERGSSMALQPTRRRFTIGDYYRMAETGVLTRDDRVELIDGEIVDMSPIGRRHAASLSRLTRLFVLNLAEAAIVRVQDPVRLGEHDEPEPDLALVHPRADFFVSGHPTAQDAFLLVEVSDTSVEYDRQVKASLYARNGIPEYWQVDVNRDHLVVYRDPTADGYATTGVLRRGETISPLAFPELRIAISDVLGESD